MKAMNEFETVLVIATVILAVCATIDLSLNPSGAAVANSDNPYSGLGIAQSTELLKRDGIGIVRGGSHVEPLLAASAEADDAKRHAPSLQMRLPRQARMSW